MSEEKPQSRHTPNLQGILRFCTEITTHENDTGSTFSSMSEEQKQWLKDALESVGANDPVKKMIEYLKIILKSSDSGDLKNDVEQKEVALEELACFCEDIDLANDFYKIGGFDIFPLLLNGSDESLKWKAAELLAVLIQNNPFCQEKVLDGGIILEILLQKLKNENECTDVKVKCLYAASCLARECERGRKELIKLNGLNAIINLMHSDVEKLQIKSLFLINSLCIESNEIRGFILLWNSCLTVSQTLLKFFESDLLNSLNIMDDLTQLIQSETSTTVHGFAVKALINLILDNELMREKLKSAKYDLKASLEKRLNGLKEDKDYQEEVDELKLLLKIFD
ncbi:hypothetical protein HELRODRAFT_166151 [Helobdella robusta]|uniref:Hsp70-binding protein 1 n=1 Tax=Helobdella robusta TaxID=6412 RepID=T1EXU5_HELRO|nr:hypothetical protein HELRODRAFT_166151 [Helobdella robusta]ESN90480.1 hypothetical protein HELRODRAFT_166151 [Helobdella robusta]